MMPQCHEEIRVSSDITSARRLWRDPPQRQSRGLISAWNCQISAAGSLRHPHRQPSRPFIGRGTTHEGGPSPGRLPIMEHMPGRVAVAKFRPSTRRFPLPRTNESHKELVCPRPCWPALTSPGLTSITLPASWRRYRRMG